MQAYWRLRIGLSFANSFLTARKIRIWSTYRTWLTGVKLWRAQKTIQQWKPLQYPESYKWTFSKKTKKNFTRWPAESTERCDRCSSYRHQSPHPIGDKIYQKSRRRRNIAKYWPIPALHLGPCHSMHTPVSVRRLKRLFLRQYNWARWQSHIESGRGVLLQDSSSAAGLLQYGPVRDLETITTKDIPPS